MGRGEEVRGGGGEKRILNKLLGSYEPGAGPRRQGFSIFSVCTGQADVKKRRKFVKY